ncbi:MULTISPECIES: TAXI family TRAP transporter solute-binding subunit [unclassified Beijerinckia]|uniref:TAXI family TRAP transporter solute-binding subunit n=1 Tax=unclassified Beijerinckia TaxID=2638183 RepID=UPI00147A5972|nr:MULTISPECIES: TAXI family TRAP transporter solute-binding subunit [unclassified Beijerinckia]
MTKIPPPSLDNPPTLHFMGDWGRANLHRVMGWLGYELGRLAGPQFRFAIWNSTGGMDAARAVGRGEIDVAIMTPACCARMPFEGTGFSADEAFPHLRALGLVPQNDRLILAIRREHDIRSFADLRAKQPPLKIIAARDDGTNPIGMMTQTFMHTAGIPRTTLESWGGRYLERDEPIDCFRDMIAGRADAIIMEAVMSEFWHNMARQVDLFYLPIEAATKEQLQRTYGWTSATLPANYQPGLDVESEFLDFSDFILLTTTDLPDDVAYAMAWSLVERYEGLSRQYAHIPSERSPVNYPIDPKAACRTPIPLHPGAERYFREAGHLTKQP